MILERHDPPKIIAVDPSEGKIGGPWPKKIVVKFSKDIKPETINTDTFVVISEDWQGKKRVKGSVTYNAQTREAVFTPAEGFFPSGAQTDFTIRLRGSGPQAITGEDGQRLDGDGDGQPGGNFSSWFRLIG